MSSLGPAARHYAGRDDADSQTSPPEVSAGLERWLSQVGDVSPLLDVGCGVGSNLELMRARGLSVIGSEISRPAAVAARRSAPVAVADGMRLPFADGAFGAAVCTEVLEHVDDPRVVFAEMQRVLRPGAFAYVTAPNYANLAGLHKWWADRRTGRHDWNPWGAHEGGYEAFMTGRRLAAAAARHFEVLSVRGLDYGQALTGRFPTLDRLATQATVNRGVTRFLELLYRRAGDPVIRWHGMHVELTLRRRAARG